MVNRWNRRAEIPFAHYDERWKHSPRIRGFCNESGRLRGKAHRQKPIVFVEQLLEMDYAPDTHGTADAIIISGDTLTIIDNKTGLSGSCIREDGSLNSS